MKFLYLVRHAKAISTELGINDFKRSLSKQGLQDAQNMGSRLKEKGIKPGLLMSSPADRALETAHIFARELNYPVRKIFLRDAFYDENLSIILEILKNRDESYDTLMLVGHEPSLSQIAALLLKGTEPVLRTGAVIGIALEIERWQDLDEAAGTLILFDFPTRATPKVYKRARKIITREIRASIEHRLENLDRGSSQQLNGILEKTSKRLAKQLTKVLQASQVEDIASVTQAEQRIDLLEQFAGEERDGDAVMEGCAPPDEQHERKETETSSQV
ncbi:hypothetical protein CSB45_02765 [candidate division KSB3 bacterium]|uniref:Phosphohistidine phosphatase n=1 Tax=candidate division KSB3 bacterium TaxID=2044937 RepID=A0A2G6EB04_9BACT|nr:MAG: hypothetical protein CSB45_02765 [candidate division KSB3 bacterium]